MKITGAEFREWHETAWPEGYVWADDTILPDGRELYSEDSKLLFNVEPEEIFAIPDGWWIIKENNQEHGKSVRDFIKEWRKKKALTILVIEIPRDQEKEFRLLLGNNGAKTLN